MAASAEEPAVAGSILECAEKDAETLDWLSIPADQRIIDDKTLEWVADVPGLFATDDVLECEEKENMEPEPKRTKLENCSPVANVKDKRFMDLTGSPELASCSKGYVPPNTQAVAVADLGGVRGVQMHPPLAASNVFCVHNCTSPSNDYAAVACSNNNQAQLHTHVSVPY